LYVYTVHSVIPLPAEREQASDSRMWYLISFSRYNYVQHISFIPTHITTRCARVRFLLNQVATFALSYLPLHICSYAAAHVSILFNLTHISSLRPDAHYNHVCMCPHPPISHYDHVCMCPHPSISHYDHVCMCLHPPISHYDHVCTVTKSTKPSSFYAHRYPNFCHWPLNKKRRRRPNLIRRVKQTSRTIERCKLFMRFAGGLYRIVCS